MVELKFKQTKTKRSELDPIQGKIKISKNIVILLQQHKPVGTMPFKYWEKGKYLSKQTNPFVYPTGTIELNRDVLFLASTGKERMKDYLKIYYFDDP